MLLAWDANWRPASSAAALFEVWYRRHLRPALLRAALERLVPGAEVEAALRRVMPADDLAGDARVDLDLVEHPERAFGADGRQIIAGIVERTLPAAVADLEALLGRDRSGWSWGALHVARPAHPLAALLAAVPEERLRAGPLPRGGSGDTVGHTAYGSDFVQTAGSSFRVVIDVGNWDASIAMNAPGQSGRLDDPHAADLFEDWASGRSFPLAYSRSAVDAVAEHVIELRPPDHPAAAVDQAG